MPDKIEDRHAPSACRCTPCVTLRDHDHVDHEATKGKVIDCLNRLIGDSKGLQAVRRELTDERDKVQRLGERHDVLRDELALSISRGRDTDDELANLQGQLARYTAQSRDGEALQGYKAPAKGQSVSQKNEQIAKLEVNNLALRVELQGKAKSMEKLKTELRTNGKESDKLKIEVKRKDDMISFLRGTAMRGEQLPVGCQQGPSCQTEQTSSSRASSAPVVSQIDKFKLDLEKKEHRIKGLNDKLNVKDAQISKLRDQVHNKGTDMSILKDRKSSQIGNLKESIEAKDRRIDKPKNRAVPPNTQIKTLETKVGDKLAEIQNLKKGISAKDTQIATLRSDIVQKDIVIRNLDATHGARNPEHEEFQDRVIELESELSQRDSEILTLIYSIVDNCSEINKLQEQLSTQNTNMMTLETTLSATDTDIIDLHAKVTTRDTKIAALHTTLAAKDEQLLAFKPTLEQKAQARVVQLDLDWEDQMADLQRVEAAKDEWRRVDEQLRAKQHRRKRAFELDEDDVGSMRSEIKRAKIG